MVPERRDTAYVTCREKCVTVLKTLVFFVQPVFSSRQTLSPISGAAVPLLGHRQTQLTLVGGWGVKLQSALDHAQVKREGER